MTALSAASRRRRQPLVPAADRLRRRQPARLRRLRQLPQLLGAAALLRRQGRLRPMSALGPIGRLGRFAATHRRAVFITWAVIAVGLGVLAPRVETALSGAGWQANGSESVKVREQLDANFGGAGAYALQVAVHSQELTVADPAFRRTVARVERVLAADSAVGTRRLAAPRRLDLPRRPHRDRRRHRRQEPERNGRRGQRPEVGSQPRSRLPGSKRTSPAPPACGRTSTKPTAKR